MLILLLWNISHASGISPDALEELFRQTIALRFSELNNSKIQLLPFESKTDFFHSNFDAREIFAHSKTRIYKIYYNQNLKFQSPSVDAIRGILTHELAHIVDYQKKSAWELSRLGWLYWYNEHSPEIISYERKIDIMALCRGAGSELIAFRRWLYQNVDPETLQWKKITYLSPEEITRWMEKPSTCSSPES